MYLKFFNHLPLKKLNIRFRLFGNLRLDATSRKVEGSNSDELIAFFSLFNHSRHSMPLGFTQPLTDMSARNLPTSPSMSRLSCNCEISTCHNPTGLQSLLLSELMSSYPFIVSLARRNNTISIRRSSFRLLGDVQTPESY
jgi:hypothetical protein